MIKEDNRLIRVPVIPKYIFNKRTRRWSWKFYVQSMDETIDFKDFTLRNKDNLIKGKRNIRKAHNSYIQTKRSNMEEYRRKLRMQLEIKTKTYKRKR